MYYNGATSYFFVNSTETHKFNTKDSEIVAVLLCLGNISEDFSTDNMKKKLDWLDLSLIGCYCSSWYIRHSQIFSKNEWDNRKRFDL